MNLTARSGRLVGRDAECAALTEALGGHRMVTVVGPPGVGKTCLVAEVARTVASSWADGVVRVELAGARTGQFAGALATALSLPDIPGRSLADTLAASLSQQNVLLVLDTCEHVADEVESLASALIRACPDIGVMATSCIPLAVAEGTTWPLAPLRVPAPHTTDVDEVASSPAVALFVARARSVQPEFVLDRSSAPAVAEICRRLDGLPLAIELAAARADVVSPHQLVGLLDAPVGLSHVLEEVNRVDDAARRSLEKAFVRSYDLLSAPEATLLRRMSVFSGGADEAALSETCSGTRLPAESVGRCLRLLVAASLVMVSEVPEHQPRYFLLETIRRFARQRLLQQSEFDDASRRHARWATGLSEAAEPHLTGPGQQAWLCRLDVEAGNLRGALEWLLGEGEGEQTMRLATSLTLWWRARGNCSEGRHWLEAALAATPDGATAMRSRTLWGLGQMRLMTGEREASVEALEESLAMARALGDTRTCARSLLLLGNSRQMSQAWRSAMPLLEQSVELAGEADDPWCLAHALAVSARVQLASGEVHDGRRSLSRAAEVARGAGDELGLVYALTQSGILEHTAGRPEPAAATLEEAAMIARLCGYRHAEASATVALGTVVLGTGDHKTAERLLEHGLSTARCAAASGALVDAFHGLGQLAMLTGDLARARSCFRTGEEVAGALGWVSVGITYGLAQLAVAGGHLAAAETLVLDGLRMAGAAGWRREIAGGLLLLGTLARAGHDLERAHAASLEALSMYHRDGNPAGIADALEEVAAAVAADDRVVHATKLMAAAEAVRSGHGLARARPDFTGSLHQVLLRESRLSQELASAWTAGAALDTEAAVALAERWSTEPRPADPWWALTEVEHAVAELITEGLTNKAIATRLFVSPHTVRAHVSKILAKLGVGSRSEVAREAVRRKAKYGHMGDAARISGP